MRVRKCENEHRRRRSGEGGRQKIDSRQTDIHKFMLILSGIIYWKYKGRTGDEGRGHVVREELATILAERRSYIGISFLHFKTHIWRLRFGWLWLKELMLVWCGGIIVNREWVACTVVVKDRIIDGLSWLGETLQIGRKYSAAPSRSKYPKNEWSCGGKAKLSTR
ncbi:hypothetical protein K438DRAFT_1754096 [Mycena galopus ATCC 62051]|nr:hypothetical protein K438DRAFT_1754096 [Mycena galopus ATCC 62051]